MGPSPSCCSVDPEEPTDRLVHKLSTIVSTPAPQSFFVSSMDKEVKLQKQKGARAKNGCGGGQKTLGTFFPTHQHMET